MTLEQMKVNLRKRGKVLVRRVLLSPDGSEAREDFAVVGMSDVALLDSSAAWGEPTGVALETWYPTPEWAYAEAMGETPW